MYIVEQTSVSTLPSTNTNHLFSEAEGQEELEGVQEEYQARGGSLSAGARRHKRLPQEVHEGLERKGTIVKAVEESIGELD